jgi:hypothetical protein
MQSIVNVLVKYLLSIQGVSGSNYCDSNFFLFRNIAQFDVLLELIRNYNGQDLNSSVSKELDR